MKRQIRHDCPVVVEPAKLVAISDVKDWLEQQAAMHNLRWLLANADDGVMWGRVDNRRLITSDSVAPHISPPLCAETLQQGRLFSEHAEILLWRDSENKWRTRLIRKPTDEETPTFSEAIDEAQVLWGTHTQSLQNDFTMMSDGAQGLRHVVPLPVSGVFSELTRPVRLWVRHYIGEDTNGFARIVASRLVKLSLEAAK